MSEGTSQVPTEGQEGQQPQPEQVSPVEKRINQLTKQRREAERRAESLEGQNAELSAQINALSTQIERLASRDPQEARPSRDPFADVFSTRDRSEKAPQKQELSPEMLESLMQRTVEQALQPFVEREQAQAQSAQLQAAQHASFNDAASDLPEIREHGSLAQELFDQIWSAQPAVQQSPDGPALVIQAVRGILRDEARGEANTAARKEAARTFEPPAPRQRLQASDPSGRDLTQQRIDELGRKAKEERFLTEEERSELIGLKLGRLRVKE